MVIAWFQGSSGHIGDGGEVGVGLIGESWLGGGLLGFCVGGFADSGSGVESDRGGEFDVGLFVAFGGDAECGQPSALDVALNTFGPRDDPECGEHDAHGEHEEYFPTAVFECLNHV